MAIGKPRKRPDLKQRTFDVATCMHYSGLDPMTKKPVTVAKNLRDRKLQRALMQFFKPETYFELREAMVQPGQGQKARRAGLAKQGGRPSPARIASRSS